MHLLPFESAQSRWCVVIFFYFARTVSRVTDWKSTGMMLVLGYEFEFGPVLCAPTLNDTTVVPSHLLKRIKQKQDGVKRSPHREMKRSSRDKGVF